MLTRRVPQTQDHTDRVGWILTTRSLHPSNHKTRNDLTAQAEVLFQMANWPRRRGQSDSAADVPPASPDVEVADPPQWMIVICHRKDLTQCCWAHDHCVDPSARRIAARSQACVSSSRSASVAPHAPNAIMMRSMVVRFGRR